MLVRTDVTKLVGTKEAGMLLPTEEQLELLVHELQRHGRITAEGVYAHLQETDTLRHCLSLRDGEEVQKISVFDYERLFGKGISLVLWRSHTCSEPKPTVPVLWVDNFDKRVLKVRQVELRAYLGKDYLTPRIATK